MRIAAQGATKAGAEVTVVDLADYPLPVFDEDLEADEGMPEKAAALKQLFLSHDGLMISSPEYNSSISGALKNVIDWVSRSAPGEPAKAAFLGKAAVLMAASPGELGGLRGLVHLRSILGNISVIVLPDQIAVPQAHKAFDEHDQLTDAKQQSRIEGLGATLTKTLVKLLAD